MAGVGPRHVKTQNAGLGINRSISAGEGDGMAGAATSVSGERATADLTVQSLAKVGPSVGGVLQGT